MEHQKGVGMNQVQGKVHSKNKNTSRIMEYGKYHFYCDNQNVYHGVVNSKNLIVKQFTQKLRFYKFLLH